MSDVRGPAGGYGIRPYDLRKYPCVGAHSVRPCSFVAAPGSAGEHCSPLRENRMLGVAAGFPGASRTPPPTRNMKSCYTAALVCVGADSISARAVLWQRQTPRGEQCSPLRENRMLGVTAGLPPTHRRLGSLCEGESLAIYPKLQNKIRFSPPPAGAGAPSQRGPFGSPLQHTQT